MVTIRKQQANRAWREANREQHDALCAKWRRENQEKCKQASRKSAWKMRMAKRLLAEVVELESALDRRADPFATVIPLWSIVEYPDAAYGDFRRVVWEQDPFGTYKKRGVPFTYPPAPHTISVLRRRADERWRQALACKRTVREINKKIKQIEKAARTP